MMRRTLALLLLILSATPTCWALELANVFTDHMVLQRDAAVPVWGAADPGETVTVTIRGRSVTAAADESGRWRVELPPMPAGGPCLLDVATDKERFTLTDVLIGEVWLCSGQSNMEWPLAKSLNAGGEIANADHPRIRLFNVGKASLDQPPRDVSGQWVACEPGTAAGFSAVGYFFGRELHDKLGVPVGLIANAWGGSSAEAWMSRESLLSDPEFAYMVEGLGARRQALAQYHEAMRGWELAGPDAEAPTWPREVRQFKWATMLHDRMLLPLVPYGIRGVIWYQGEENAPRAEQYRRLFPVLIEHWRGMWGRDDLPFLFVQLTAFRQRVPEPGDSTWAELREAQGMALSVPHTAMAVTIDIGEADNIHPKNKQDVGHRLALSALAKVYGHDVEYTGPVLESASVQGKTIRLKMSHTGEGLATSDGQPPRGFAIAPTDGPYVWADARIEGDTVIVWSDKVEQPMTVRYGWADNPQATLVNSYGLPACPFRTDDRPGVTVGKR